MNISQAYIAASIVVAFVIAVLLVWIRRRRGEGRLTPLVSLAFGFIVAGVLFGSNRLIGYGLMGVGVFLAGVDIFNRSRNA